MAKFVLHRVEEPYTYTSKVVRTEKDGIEEAKALMTEHRNIESVTVWKFETVDINKDSIIKIIQSGASEESWFDPNSMTLARTIYRK